MSENLIKQITSKGYLPSPDILKIRAEELQSFITSLNPTTSFKILTEDLYEKYKHDSGLAVKKDLGDSKVSVVKSFDVEFSGSNLNSFLGLYNYRYAKIGDMLKRRPELQGCVSIKHMIDSQIKGDVKMVGMVLDITYTKNQNVMLRVEDSTGIIKVIVSASRTDVYKKTSELVLDEIIGIIGARRGQVIFANDIIFPDIPSSFQYKKANEDVTAAFISDIHIGSIDFLEDLFVKFIDWTKGKIGTERNKSTSDNLRYLFITGDMVDGVGIYPGQEEELIIKDVYAQYDVFTEFIKQIPEHINIVICPGNHDAVRLEEPQPALGKNLLKDVVKMKNITLVSNPAFVNIHGINGFSGLTTLMYHGSSFDYYCSENDLVRNNGGYDNVSFVMEFLLKKRHIAPTHSSSAYITCPIDNMIIESVPDIFVAAHTHKCSVSKYKQVNVISSSCFQKATSFQERLGHHPDPGFVPVLNLKTRQVTVMTCA